MKRIGLIACCKSKLNYETEAENLYQGVLFKKSLKYLREIEKVDEIYILSALHRVVPLDKRIGPYNETLNGKSKEYRKNWTKEVIIQLKELGLDLQNDEFIITAGKNYNEYLIKELNKVKLPLEKFKGLGYQLGFLTETLKGL